MRKSIKPKTGGPTIRVALEALEDNLDALWERLGRKDIPGWDKMDAAEQGDALNNVHPEVVAALAAVHQLSWKMFLIGRQKGQRTKLTDAMITRIKKNGRKNIARLAQKLGISRQTVYNVLGPKPKKQNEEPRPKAKEPSRMPYNDQLDSHRPKGWRRGKQKSSDNADD